MEDFFLSMKMPSLLLARPDDGDGEADKAFPWEANTLSSGLYREATAIKLSRI